MQEAIEQALHPLVGLPLWSTHRALDIQVFQFGTKIPAMTRKGEAVVIGVYGVHLQCEWRIVGPEGIKAGSYDRFYSPGNPDEEPPDFVWHKRNRRDERMEEIFAGRFDNPFGVQAVRADTWGGFTLSLSEGLALEVFPCDSLEDERWRLLNNIAPGKPHFVVTGAGTYTTLLDDENG